MASSGSASSSAAVNELMQVRPGDRVLDVGCGLGDDVRALAALVGPSGRAVGIDASEATIAKQASLRMGLG